MTITGTVKSVTLCDGYLEVAIERDLAGEFIGNDTEGELRVPLCYAKDYYIGRLVRIEVTPL